MSFYENRILPTLLDLACSTKPILEQREKVVPAAEGRVLEMGIGSGLNLEYYNPDKVTEIVGIDPSEGLGRKAARRAANLPFPVRHIRIEGEEMPVDDGEFDTVVVTYTLCTIPDAVAAMEKARRVLKPGGRVLFIEHGQAPDDNVRKWQDRLDPVWSVVAGGCHLNRNIPEILKDSGFRIDSLETMYLPKTPRFGGFNYWGAATPQ